MVEVQPATVHQQRCVVVRFKPEGMKPQSFEASSAAIHGEHLVLLNPKGRPVALFLLDIVESWSEV
jgi:hypothetical protein